MFICTVSPLPALPTCVCCSPSAAYLCVLLSQRYLPACVALQLESQTASQRVLVRVVDHRVDLPTGQKSFTYKISAHSMQVCSARVVFSGRKYNFPYSIMLPNIYYHICAWCLDLPLPPPTPSPPNN